MAVVLLVLCGAAVLIATMVAARRSRLTRAGDEAPRLWRATGSLAGLALILGGVIAAQLGSPQVPEPIEPFLIEIPADPAVQASADLEEAQEPSPEPAPTATPAPTPAATARAASPGGAAQPPAAGPQAAPAAPAAPVPTPTPPPRPGPTVGASTSCFQEGGANVASISYTVTARQGQTLASVRLLLDGSVVQQPSVSGSTSYSDSYSSQVPQGRRTFAIQAVQADGGATTRSFPVCM